MNGPDSSRRRSMARHCEAMVGFLDAGAEVFSTGLVGVGILVLLLYLPGGLVQVVYATRDLVLGWVARRRMARAPPTSS